MNQPIQNCYWIVSGAFLAGEYPRDKDDQTSRDKLGRLLDSGVTTFIDLTEADEGLLPYAQWLGTATHYRFPIQDVSVPSSPQITQDILDTIDHAIDRGELVYLHCWGGVGRTGVIVGCWLARHGHAGPVALDQLHELWKQCPKSRRRRSPETQEQERYILNWEAGK
ncbi:dual specificity protein phosphatase family protein [Leptolyngbya sp. CCY15150]|uniref:protein-tyrosine phosphatase family protein n=1 Tax=Leptolyngbya sp. CCY15150 TaxID=2767772 RepID=UPI0019526485|nr:dual specificity protein phosphatase family protein [Leptolyngbya sp. CCY15150]